VDSTNNVANVSGRLGAAGWHGSALPPQQAFCSSMTALTMQALISRVSRV